MAIDLPSASGRVDFGALTDGLTQMSVAFTVDVSGAIVSVNRFVSRWAPPPFPSWAIIIFDNDELMFIINTAAGSASRKTTTLNVTAGQLLRVVITYDGALAHADAVHFWVNGVEFANVIHHVAPFGTLRTTPLNVLVGFDAQSPQAGVDGQYSEVAIWDHVIPDWVKINYGMGMSPLFYPKGGIAYSPLWNVRQLDNQWGRKEVGRNNGGTNAAHPRTFYPPPKPRRVGFTLPPIVTFKTISVTTIQDGTISIKEKDEATI